MIQERKRPHENEEANVNKRFKSVDKIKNSNRSRNQTPVVNLDESTDFITEDADDIPYTHSRSTSPELLSSDLEDLGEEVNEDVVNNTDRTPKDEVIVLDDDYDNDIKEYYVVSDDDGLDEDDADLEELKSSQNIETNKRKTTSEQLEENKAVTKNIANLKCSVCFESPERTFILRCGHVYCGDCIYRALSCTKQSTRAGGPCSLCRKYTSYKSVSLGIFKKKKKALGKL